MRFSPRILVGFVAIALAGVVPAGPAAAHDEIESSVPEHRAELTDPISEVTVNFGEPVGNVELALVGPDNRDLPGTVTKLSDTSARLDFDLLSAEGEYIVRYLAEEEGHLVAGAFTFVYGSRSGTGAGAATWVAFGVGAVAILAVGLFFSLRRARRPADDPEPIAT